MTFKGNVVFVTGAGGGIGEALSLGAAKNEAKAVVLSDINGENARKASVSLLSKYPGCKTAGVKLDVTSENQIAEVFAWVEKEFGLIDCLISNAGVQFSDKAPDYNVTSASNQVWEKQWQVNNMAHIYLTRPLLDKWMARGSGRLVITASAAGLLVNPGDCAYGVTKAAAVAFAQHCYVMHHARGVKVHCICPQGVDTPMLHAAKRKVGPAGPAALALLDGVVTATDVAEALVQAIKEDRFYVFPHPIIQRYIAFRGTQPEKWIKALGKNVGGSLAKQLPAAKL